MKVEVTCTGCGARFALEYGGYVPFGSRKRFDSMVELARKFMDIHNGCPGGNKITAS